MKDNKMYIGFSTDVNRRLKEHNNGKNRSTFNRRPLKLIYYEAHTNKSAALKRENYFKTTKGKTMLRIILKDVLSELYPGT